MLFQALIRHGGTCLFGTCAHRHGGTDVLIGASDAPSPELSYVHGFEGASFHGFSKVGFFQLLQLIGNAKLKKIGSDFVVQRYRYHQLKSFFEIYEMGMVSWL